MPEPTTVASLKTLFRFPFQGPEWRSRFLVGALLLFAGSLIPIVPVLFVYGYLVEVARRAVKGEELTPPAWQNWGRLAVDGLRATVVGLIFVAPGIIVMSGGVILYVVAIFAASFQTAADPYGSMASTMPMVVLICIAILFLSMFFGLLFMLLGGIPLPMAAAHFVARDKVSAALHVREWWRLIEVNKLGYLVAWVVVAGLMAVLYTVYMLVYYAGLVCFPICLLLPLLTAPVGFYLSLVSVALFGQIYRQSEELAAESKT